MTHAFGLDFGTTNSALARSDGSTTELARWPSDSGPTQTFRSVLFFDPDDTDSLGRVVPHSGPAGIARYHERMGEGRLMQSIKSHLASRGLVGTTIYGRQVKLEDLIARIVLDLRAGAEATFGRIDGPVVVGRPVRYVGSKGVDDDDFAVERMRKALAIAGFDDVRFAFEPVAAASHYEQRLDHDEVLLVGDFGGGTADFCLMFAGPTARDGRERILGAAGVGIAGDSFDGKIIRNLVGPALGRGTTYRTMFGKDLKVPDWWYSALEHWHRLSMLATPKTLRAMEQLAHSAQDPAQLRGLVHIVRDNLGFALARAVEATKIGLSGADEAPFVFEEDPVFLNDLLSRDHFESWIDKELRQIATCVDGLLTDVGIETGDVDRVFLTGGSSQVPAVHRLFVDRFGADKVHGGEHLTSVANGLAVLAANEHLQT